MLSTGRREGWRYRAIFGAVVLLFVSASVAQAVSTVNKPGAGGRSGGAWTAGSLDAADLAVGYIPPTTTALTPTADHAAAIAIAAADPSDISGTTVIDETRAERVAEVSADTHYDVPRAALVAYKRAAIVMAKTTPGCNLEWPILAGIGQVESDQGRYAGAHVMADGTTSPHIVGLPLNGQGNVARIPDSDDGRFDGDTVWDRAVGPMQFIPTTWAVVGVDGDGDGVRDPHDFDDAALAAGVYLCAGGRDLATTSGMTAAIYSYNHSDSYVALVMSIAKRYENGGIDVVPNDTTPGTPDPGTGSGNPDPKPRPTAVLVPEPDHDPDPGPDPDPDPGPGPGPDPDPKPTPTVLNGTLHLCAEPGATPQHWCVGATVLDFGDDADLRPTQGDYDGDGTAEPVSVELNGLRGTEVRVRLDNGHIVEAINGTTYKVIPIGQNGPGPTTPPTTTPTPIEPTQPAPTDETGTEPTPTGVGPTGSNPSGSATAAVD